MLILINTREITLESKAACERLADAGIQLGNQMVLLNGVIMISMCGKLNQVCLE